MGVSLSSPGGRSAGRPYLGLLVVMAICCSPSGGTPPRIPIEDGGATVATSTRNGSTAEKMIRAERDPALRARIRSVVPLPGVRAGSALIFTGGRLLVVQDDALAVAWVDPRTGAIERVALEGEGGALVKAKKPDFESAFVGRDGKVTLLGSGSTSTRYRAALLDIAGGGAARFLDCAPLFHAIGAQLGAAPNLEGAVQLGERLHLFHRGSGADLSAIAEVSAGAIGADAVTVLTLTRCDLGTAAGVPLTFTDATACGDAMVYLAVAEDTPNAVDDGPIAGAAVGVIAGGRARFALLEEADGTLSKRKVEGIAVDQETRSTYLVTDPDDPARPAELCRVDLEGFPP